MTYLINVPLVGSILGCVLTFILLIFQLKSASAFIPLLGSVFGVEFYLDPLNAFSLFCLFLSGALFLSFKAELSFSQYFAFPYILTQLLLLSSNLYFLVILLSLLIMMIYGVFSKKTSSPLIGLAGLFISVLLFPSTVNLQNNFSYLSFDALRQLSFSPYILFFIEICSVTLLGFFPFGKWRLMIAKSSQGTLLYSFFHIVLSIAGIYLLLRFWLDLGRNSDRVVLSTFLELIGLIGAIAAGWNSLVVKTVYERINCLFILSNGILVQTIGILSAFTINVNPPWIIFANDILYFGFFIQFIGFSLAFILVARVCLDQQSRGIGLAFSPYILISLLFLSFIISGFPPFAGFSLLWGNLQLLLALPLGNQFIGTLITTLAIGLNAGVFILSILGWMRLILTGGIPALQNAVITFPDYFSRRNFDSVKGWLLLLLLFSLVPGLILSMARMISTQVMGLTDYSHAFLTFSNVVNHVTFTPWEVILLFIGIVMVIGWIAKREHKKNSNLPISSFKGATYSPRIKNIDETSFGFGQASFQFMLESRFPFVHPAITSARYLGIQWIYFQRRYFRFTNKVNIVIWQYQDQLILVMVGLGLLSISLIAR
ncbi:hypothetical protein [Commensalibacter oyaizuii]|uniref:NADH:quinone oxidoreductase/Mrp antiporter membrane subunit domain-containing protein n=1 Tax=Commensalibacter oyaizuii TaxID=3043873 RepID=A0ABT6Q0J4_9PROT|nr:hypothetical protein [Commensalibacter sp. TBRC 16381]MDI2090615.1 hypothetical protein [Commensalibacter sp. TBRC 16381]